MDIAVLRSSNGYWYVRDPAISQLNFKGGDYLLPALTTDGDPCSIAQRTKISSMANNPCYAETVFGYLSISVSVWERTYTVVVD